MYQIMTFDPTGKHQAQISALQLLGPCASSPCPRLMPGTCGATGYGTWRWTPAWRSRPWGVSSPLLDLSMDDPTRAKRMLVVAMVDTGFEPVTSSV